MPTKIVMPQLGESVVEGTVNKWLKQVGDSVTEYEPLLEISTDKVDTEVPAPASGILLQILVPAGQTVERGVLLALIGDPNEVEAPHPTTHPEIVSTNGIESVSVANRISPVVARMAAEHRIDPRKMLIRIWHSHPLPRQKHPICRRGNNPLKAICSSQRVKYSPKHANPSRLRLRRHPRPLLHKCQSEKLARGLCHPLRKTSHRSRPLHLLTMVLMVALPMATK